MERARARSELVTPDARRSDLEAGRSDLEAEELALPTSADEWLVQVCLGFMFGFGFGVGLGFGFGFGLGLDDVCPPLPTSADEWLAQVRDMSQGGKGPP